MLKKSYEKMMKAKQDGIYPMFLSFSGSEFYVCPDYTPACIQVVFSKHLWPSFEVAEAMARINLRKRGEL